MSFTSLQFIVFLIITLAVYYITPKIIRKYVLLAASIVFYYGFGIKAMSILLFAALLAYFGGLVIGAIPWKSMKTFVFMLFVIGEIGMLIALKYVGAIRTTFSLVVPVGISFYTLSIVGYLFDVYKEKYKSEKNPFRFLLYVMYFPHILQGPIARYDQLGEQFNCLVPFSYDRICSGAQLMLWGFIKKLVVADRLNVFVSAVFDKVDAQSGTMLLLAALGYSVQIYADFSGCVDIARGASEIFGIDLIQNFKQPYMATSINDFWRRWHISLSSYFKDYVYIPLGGNRRGVVMRWVNVMIVFAISGLWHGVGIGFFIWGLLHGLLQIVGAMLMPIRRFIVRICGIDSSGLGLAIFQSIVTFILVTFAWIFFRIENVQDAVMVFTKIFTDFAPWQLLDQSIYSLGVNQYQWDVLLLFIFAMFVVDILHENQFHIRDAIAKRFLLVRWLIYLFAIFSVVIFGVYGIGYNAESFIYMNF